MDIETKFDIPPVAALALKEKQIQQNYRPIIAVHKWFTRRPGTLFRGLVLAEFGDRPLIICSSKSINFPGKKVADPIMGGGTPLLEANGLGCDVPGFDRVGNRRDMPRRIRVHIAGLPLFYMVRRGHDRDVCFLGTKIAKRNCTGSERACQPLIVSCMRMC